MATIPKSPFLFLVIIILSLISLSISSESGDDRVNELLTLQSRSQSGLIRLNDQSISRYLTSVKTPRPYWIVVFFDATQLHEKPELRLKELRTEFALVASSYIANNKDFSSPSHGKLFFCDIEFKESQSSFALFGVNALPHIRLIAPHQGPKESDQMDQGDLSRLDESTTPSTIDADWKLGKRARKRRRRPWKELKEKREETRDLARKRGRAGEEDGDGNN